MSEAPQSFQNHAKIVFAYHRVATIFIMVPLLYLLYHTIKDFSVERLMFVLMAAGLLLAAFYARVFALGVQDRVIRLEERMRMERLLPDDLKAKIPDFTTAQLIGLRFASDEELPDLARRVLAGEFGDRKSIKAAVKNWRPDHQRV